MKLIRLGLFSLAFLLSVTIHAQKPKFKFGKITPKDFTLPAGIDSTTEAVILYDYGYLYYDATGGFHKELELRRKILILDKKGLNWANLERNLRKFGSTRDEQEKIMSFKGAVYNLDGNTVKKTKVSKSKSITEEYDENWNTFKLSFPDVKVGSIIEYKMRISSPSYLINDWYFQHSVPTMLSEFWLQVPDFFYFKKNTRGYQGLSDFKEQSKNSSLMTSRGLIDIDIQEYYYAMDTVPAFVGESFIDSEKNYLACIEHELNRTRFPGDVVKTYSETWVGVTKGLLKYSYFGKKLKSNKAIETKAAEIKATHKEPMSQVEAALKWVQANIEWNGRKRLFVYNSLKKVIKEKTGSSAEVNFVLIQLLRELGFSANPVVLSTRDNGIIHPTRVSTDQLNYVVAHLKLDDKVILLDATEKNCPVGLLPIRTQNGKGRLISKSWNWVNLETGVKALENNNFRLNLTPDGTFSGKARLSNSGYEAYNLRGRLDDFSNEEEYIEELEKENSGLEIEEYKIINRNEINKPINLDISIKLTDQADVTGDLISFCPLLIEKLDESPFKIEERKYPVDFAYPRNSTDMVMIQIPEGYEIESFPQAVSIGLPEKTGKFQFTVNQQGRMLVVRSVVHINKKQYYATEYPYLKQFFDMIVAKHAERIVLKKKSGR